MTKLQAWNVSGFDRVAFVDADLFPTRANADGLFELCADPDADLCCAVERGSRIMNSGIMVTRPSAARFNRMLAALDEFKKETAVFPDMAFLSRYFEVERYMKSANRSLRGWSNRSVPLRFPNGSFYGSPSRLYLFNVDRGGHRLQSSAYHNCPELARTISSDKGRMATGVLRKSVDKVKLWHACGRHKLETLPLCSKTSAIQASDHPFCVTRLLHLYQWLYRKANPCVAGSSSPGRCGAEAGCRWCSDLVRCIPKGWNCFESDLATKAFEERMTRPRGMSTIRPGWCNHQCDEACCASVTRKAVAKAERRKNHSLTTARTARRVSRAVQRH
eukprot:6454433-Prymnesium_polylepis.1